MRIMLTSKNKKPGRPRAAPEDKRSEQVCLRMTTLELALIDRAIELTHGRNRSAVMINLLTTWAWETVHRLADEVEQKEWPLEAFPGIRGTREANAIVPSFASAENVQRGRKADSGSAPIRMLAEAHPAPVIDQETARAMLEQLLLALKSISSK
jgi:hypothetical protein